MKDLKSYLSTGSCKNIRWLNDENLCYVAVDPDGNHIKTLDIMTGEEKVLFSAKEAITDLVCKMDKIIFTSDVGGNENAQIFLLTENGPVNITNDPKTRVNFGSLMNDGKTMVFNDNARNHFNFDIVSQDLETGEKKLLWANDGSTLTVHGLSPDEKYCCFTRRNTIYDNPIYKLELASGNVTLCPNYEKPRKGTHVCWTPDSEGFFFVNDEDNDMTYVSYYCLDGDKAREVVRFDGEVTDLALSGDGKHLAIVVIKDGYEELKFWSVENSCLEAFAAPPEGGYDSLSWSPDSKRLALTVTTGTRPKDIWLVDIEADQVVRLTESYADGMSADDFVEPSLHWFESFDGLKVPFNLYVPKGMKAENLPVIVSIHGGPEGISRPVLAGKELIQFYVSQGLAIVEPNVRGSICYGKVYSHLDDVEKRLDSVKDIEWLVKHLVESGIADKDRIGVMGASYGGFMTLNCAGRMPDLWCCAVATVGMFNLVTFLENTSPYRRAAREIEYGTLANDRQLLYDVSPVAAVDGIKGPLMIIHGENDPRVPVTESYQAVEYLKSRGVDVTLITYPDEGHGVKKFANRIDLYPRVLEYVKKQMGL